MGKGQEALLAAYGEGRVKVVRLLLSRGLQGRHHAGDPGRPTAFLSTALSLPRRPHWVMHAMFLPPHTEEGGGRRAWDKGKGPRDAAQQVPAGPAAAPLVAPPEQYAAGTVESQAPTWRLAVGLSDNSVEVWRLTQTLLGISRGLGSVAGWTASLEASFRASGKSGLPSPCASLHQAYMPLPSCMPPPDPGCPSPNARLHPSLDARWGTPAPERGCR